MALNNILKKNDLHLFCDKLTVNSITPPDIPTIPSDITVNSITLEQFEGNGKCIISYNSDEVYELKFPQVPLIAKSPLVIDNPFTGQLEFQQDNLSINSIYNTNDIFFKFPNSTGSLGQVLSTDGAGNTSWINQSSGGGNNLVFFANSTKGGTSLGYNAGDSTFLTSSIQLDVGTYIVCVNASYTLSGSNKGSVKIRVADSSNPNINILDSQFPRVKNFNGNNQFDDKQFTVKSKIQIINATTTIFPSWSNEDNTLDSGAGINTITLSWADIEVYKL